MVLDWLGIITALASVAMAVIAFLALRNWKRQDKAKREVEFLHTIIEVAQAYISEISGPIRLLELSQTGMECYVRPGEKSDQENAILNGAIAYIHRNGASDAERLSKEMDVARHSVIKLKSLVTIGQAFKFVGYEKCWNAVERLDWQFDQIERFRLIIGSPTWNWANPAVLKSLKDVMAIDPKKMRKCNYEDNMALLEFYSEIYQRIYG